VLVDLLSGELAELTDDVALLPIQVS